jgi:hypothetical protein
MKKFVGDQLDRICESGAMPSSMAAVRGRLFP